MFTSSRIRSNVSLTMAFSAASPSTASVVVWPAWVRILSSTMRLTPLSSASRIFSGLGGSGARLAGAGRKLPQSRRPFFARGQNYPARPRAPPRPARNGAPAPGRRRAPPRPGKAARRFAARQTFSPDRKSDPPGVAAFSLRRAGARNAASCPHRRRQSVRTRTARPRRFRF